jgi:caffeoyl-CoA O-methyltransferase
MRPVNTGQYYKGINIMSHMVSNPQAYYGQWLPTRSDLLMSLEAQALEQNIPIVGPVFGQMLYLLARSARVQHVLELGTAIGYSTIFLGLACRSTGGTVISIEKDAAMAEQARHNIAAAALTAKIEVRCLDVLVALHSIQNVFDLIFMDIEKEDYIRVLPDCKRLLSPNGLLIVDNTGFKEADSFNKTIYRDNDWEKVNLWSFLPGHSPGHDGFCLAMKASVPG